MAGSGDYCGPGHYLTSEAQCTHQYAYYYETESWDTYGYGHKSCTGTASESGAWYSWSCAPGNKAPYYESYCNPCNSTGYGFVENFSTGASYFTGWGSWQ